MDISRIFVYGTLLSGMSNHERFCGDALTIEPAVTTGRLYHLPYGFPAMFDVPDGQVFGEVMTFTNIEEKLKQLDYLEGYSPGKNCHYLRVAKNIVLLGIEKTVAAWTYIYAENKKDDIGGSEILISNGNWRDFIERNN